MQPVTATQPVAQQGGRFPLRIWVYFCVLGAECFAAHLVPHGSVYILGALLIVFSGTLLFFGRQQPVYHMKDDAAINLYLLALHALLLAAFFWIQLTHPRTVPGFTGMAVFTGREWTAWALALFATLSLTFFPTRVQWNLLRGFGKAWIYAALAAVAVIPSTVLSTDAWNFPNSWLVVALRNAAFTGVFHILRLFYAGVVADPSHELIGTARFQVIVAGECSGVQGVGLMLILTMSWLIYARRELRVWRTLLLVPVALVAVWLMNLFRIAALIAIGDAGHVEVAVHGFHSDAGWVLFNAVAFAFLFVANRMRWLHKSDGIKVGEEIAETRNDAVVYLLPFVLIVAASMVGRMASSNFDWLYPLRLVAAVVALWWLRAEYRRMDWRFGWLGPLAGTAVFLLWLVLARVHHASGAQLGPSLHLLAPWQRLGWITARAIAAVITVPIAEELAFRGYLARRIMSPDVETVLYSKLNLAAIVVSSLLFGLMHGNMWIAGTIAGLAFALVAKVRGRLGEAVAAHATANLLIALWVLTTGDYAMW